MNFSWLGKRVEYSALNEAESKDEGEGESSKDHEIERLKKANTKVITIAAFFGLIAMIELGWILQPLQFGWSNAKPADQTEFESARVAVGNDYIQKEFAGNWVYDEENNFVKRSVDLSRPQYFGNPHDLPEIEGNWDSLLEAEFPALTEQEAETFPDLTKVAGLEDKYIELDVTRNLNCINHLRKMLYTSYYNQTGPDNHLQTSGDPEGFYLMHMDYCLEQLFESTICHSDLTPAPVYTFVPNTRRATFSIGGTHTCRNFESVRGWLYNRAKQRPSINADGAVYRPP